MRTARAVCDPVLVVLGAQALDVWRQADLGGAAVLANKDWETGMASLRTGLDGLIGWPDQVDAALIMLVDMPGMTAEALQRLREVDHGRAGGGDLRRRPQPPCPARPRPLGRVKETVTGDEGARRYLAGHEVTEVDCTGLADPTDLDVPADRRSVPVLDPGLDELGRPAAWASTSSQRSRTRSSISVSPIGIVASRRSAWSTSGSEHRVDEAAAGSHREMAGLDVQIGVDHAGVVGRVHLGRGQRPAVRLDQDRVLLEVGHRGAPQRSWHGMAS